MGTHRRAAVFLAVALVMAVVAPAAAAPPDRDDVWIVTLDDDHPSAIHAQGLARRHGGEIWHVYSHALNGFSFRGPEQAARGIARSPGVASVEPDRPVHATSNTIPTGVDRIGALEAHAGGYSGVGVRIAILDTGIDATHPALDVDVWLGENCVDAASDSTQDVNSHGTHVAGTASASVDGAAFVGVATRATLVPVKVLDDSGSGSWASVICGVDHVTENAGGIHVANMSLSGSGSAGSECSSSPLRQAICASVGAGVVYTVAAGNSGSNVANSVPAAFPEVITVSALDEARCVRVTGGGPPRTRCEEGLASFSNHGTGVDVIAPGVRIYSTLPGGGYGTKSGTSMAAPHVAGLAAVMRSADPSLSPDGIRAALQETGECPNGSQNGDTGPCTSGQWFMDPDGTAEPLVSAARAATAAGPPPPGDAPGEDPPGDEDPVGGDPDEPQDGISLTVSTYKVRGLQKADLAWDGLAAGKVDVFRNGAIIATVTDDGVYTDDIDARGGGSYSYWVCESESGVCSAAVTVTF